jgi:hypothetical protein
MLVKLFRVVPTWTYWTLGVAAWVLLLHYLLAPLFWYEYYLPWDMETCPVYGYATIHVSGDIVPCDSLAFKSTGWQELVGSYIFPTLIVLAVIMLVYGTTGRSDQAYAQECKEI